jgi:hypothetical protein
LPPAVLFPDTDTSLWLLNGVLPEKGFSELSDPIAKDNIVVLELSRMKNGKYFYPTFHFHLFLDDLQDAFAY